MQEKPAIYLRAMEPSDYEVTHPWRMDPDIADMVVGPRRYVSLSTEKEWVSRMIAEHEKGSQQRWSICLKDGEKMIGMCSLHTIDHINRTCLTGLLIGDKNYWGMGVGKKAYTSTLDHAFVQLNMNSVRGNIISTNIVSLKMHEGMGFNIDGIQRQASYKNGSYHDLIMISLLRSEYLQLRDGWSK